MAIVFFIFASIGFTIGTIAMSKDFIAGLPAFVGSYMLLLKPTWAGFGLWFFGIIFAIVGFAS